MLPIQVASNYEQCEIFSSILLDSNLIVVGFDTETTVGQKQASTIQLSTDTNCYIFQLYRIFKNSDKLPPKIIKILQNPNIIKIGADLMSDNIKLLPYGITLRGCIDIQCIARTMLIPDISLDGLINKFLPNLIVKDTYNIGWNWDNDLNEEQIIYSAKDAYVSLIIYQKMITGAVITTNIPSKDLEREEKDYLEWLKKMTKPESFKIDKVVNQTVNSYGPWAKRYNKIERVELARKLIDKFLNEGLL